MWYAQIFVQVFRLYEFRQKLGVAGFQPPLIPLFRSFILINAKQREKERREKENVLIPLCSRKATGFSVCAANAFASALRTNLCSGLSPLRVSPETRGGWFPATVNPFVFPKSHRLFGLCCQCFRIGFTHKSLFGSFASASFARNSGWLVSSHR